jgi:oxygen-dependent protoporphyrinogen oxidase
MEKDHGSLSRAMLAARKQPRVAQPTTGGRKPRPRSLFTTLRDGMKLMVDGIASQLQTGSIRLSAPVHSITRSRIEAGDPGPDRDGWTIETSLGHERFDGIILALPAWAASDLVRPVDPVIGNLLSEIPYSSSITVTMGFNRADLASLPPGFGYLVPPTEKRNMLACTFVHAKFAGRTPADKGVLRCFLGGSGNDHLLDETDAHLTQVVLKELAEILDLEATPTFVRITRSRRAMAQYSVGHLERIQTVRENIAALPGLALAGNAYSGIGVPDCIRTGQEAAEKILFALQPEAVPAAFSETSS